MADSLSSLKTIFPSPPPSPQPPSPKDHLTTHHLLHPSSASYCEDDEDYLDVDDFGGLIHKDSLSFLKTIFHSPSPPPSPRPPSPKDLLSTHLTTSSTLLHSSSASYSEYDHPIPKHIQDKIGYAFNSLDVDDFGGLIQFWAPVVETSGGRRLLTTSKQPFSLADTENNLHKYRLCSLNYRYDVDVNYKVEVEEDPTIITTGAPATAFLNQIPELLSDMRVHPMNTLASSAFDCGLMHSFVVPVFYPSLTSCVGVVECSTSSSLELLNKFQKMNFALKKVGLRTFDARERLPYETICGLKHAKNDIDDALKIIWEMYGFNSAQVWIACENESHVAFSTSFKDTRTKRMIGLKLTGGCIYGDFGIEEYLTYRFQFYNNACDNIPLKLGEGLIGKTFPNYEPYFLNNILKLSGADKPQRFISFSNEGSCFVIYLRSSKTNDLDYVFEFLWSKSRKNDIKFESLLLTLKRCLSSFKLASGAEFGDELRILDVENSTESEFKYIEIFQKNTSSPVSKPLKKRRGPEVGERVTVLKAKCKTTPIPLSFEDIKPQFGKTMKEAAKNLSVSLSTLKRKCKVLGISEWHGKDYLKRNANHSYKNQCDTNGEDKGTIQDPSANNGDMYLDENIVTIKAEYGDDMIKFHLPISSTTFVAMWKEISERFKLNPSDYKVKYLDGDGDLISITCDKDMMVCLENQRNSNITTIKMRVLQRQI